MTFLGTTVARGDGPTPIQLQGTLASGPTSNTIGAIIQTGSDYSHAVASAIDTTTKRTAASRAADLINVMDSHGGIPGAKGDDITDDTAAINAAFAYARTVMMGSYQPYTNAQGPFANIVFPSGRKFRINGSINATGFHTPSFQVTMNGSQLDCHATGLICVDQTGSSEMTWNNLAIVGDATDTPKIGLQIGRYNQSTSADDHTFNELSVMGQFTLAGVLNEAAETTTFIHPKIQNGAGLTGSYSLIQDGSNHFNASSSFQPVSMPVDSPNSFNENLFIGADIRAGEGDGIPLFIGGTARHSFIRSYVVGGGTNCVACIGALIWNGNGYTNNMLHLDIHFETIGLKTIFSFQGSQYQAIYGFEYLDQQPFSSGTIFSAASNISYIGLQGVDIKIAQMPSSIILFDRPSVWSVGGTYSSQTTSGFNATQWQGYGNFGTASFPLNYGQSPFQFQFADGTATGGNTRGNNAVDLQGIRTTPTQVASGTQATIGGGASNTASGNQSVVAGGQGNVASGQFAMASGVNTTAKGAYSMSGGANSVAVGAGSIAVGVDSTDGGASTTFALATTRDSGGSLGQHQLSWAPWKVVTTSTTQTRVTADGAAPYVTTDSTGQPSSNCLAPPNGAAYQLVVSALMQDITAGGSAYGWTGRALMLSGNNASSLTVTASSISPDVIAVGTTSGAAISVGADKTNGCLSVSWTAPNSDTWRGTVEIHAVQVGH